MPALARLGPLADLDLEKIGGIEQVHVDPEAARGDLLAAVFAVAAEHVGDLAALAVHADDVQPPGGLGVDAKGGLPLGAEAHGRDEDRQVVASDGGVDLLGVDGEVLAEAEIEQMADGQGVFPLELPDQPGEVGVVLLHLGHGPDHLPDPRIEAELGGDGCFPGCGPRRPAPGVPVPAAPGSDPLLRIRRSWGSRRSPPARGRGRWRQSTCHSLRFHGSPWWR